MHLMLSGLGWGGVLMDDRKYAFYPVPDNEAVVINSTNDFELALVLKKKQQNRLFVIETINRTIKEKDSVLKNSLEEPSICFVGHSQLDQWSVQEIAGYRVRNCGISGISSFEYDEKILRQNILNCNANVFLVMHGTNDIVWDYSIQEIVDSIKNTINYIRKNNPKAPILFVSCLHVNGRLDRNNKRIDEMNSSLKSALGETVCWIDTSFMNDKYGKLDESYTKDGLHITDLGYNALLEKIQKTMEDIGL